MVHFGYIKSESDKELLKSNRPIQEKRDILNKWHVLGCDYCGEYSDAEVDQWISYAITKNWI